MIQNSFGSLDINNVFMLNFAAGGREISFADSYRASSFPPLQFLYILALVAISYIILLRR